MALLFPELFVSFKANGSRVDAEAVAGGSGAVGEYVAQVGAAVVAQGFGAQVSGAAVFGCVDDVGAERGVKTGPSAPGVKLGGAGKEGLIAHDATVGASPVFVPINAGEGSFGARLLGAVILLAG